MSDPVYLAYYDASGAYTNLFFDIVIDERWDEPVSLPTNPVEVGVAVSDHIRPEVRKVTLRIHATNHPFDLAPPWTTGDLGLSDPIDLPAVINDAPPTNVDVITWDDQLALKILANTAGGFLGGAVGGALGGPTGQVVGGVLGSVAAGALSGALLQGHLVHTPTTLASANLPLASTPQPYQAPQVVYADENTDFVEQTIAALETFRELGQTFDVYGSKSVCLGTVPNMGAMAIENLSYARGRESGDGANITLTLKQIRVVSTVTVPAPAPTAIDASARVSKGNVQTFDMQADVQAQQAADAAGPFTEGYNAGKANGAAAALE